MNYEIMLDVGQGSTKIMHYNQLKKVKGPGSVPGEAEVPAEETSDDAERQPRRLGRVCQCPEGRGADIRDPDIPWIP
jgi:hypothetical protein